MRRRKLIIGNWKMNPASLAEARALFGKVKRAAEKLERIETVLCPPFPYLGAFAHSGTARFFLGAQDVFWENSRRATGEVPPEMLADLGVSHVIVGHSERRALGETNEVVAKKTLAALKEGLRAIACVGEKERDSDGRFYAALKNQLAQSLSCVPRRYFLDLAIAYEPLFAIGKSAREAMTPRDICEISIFIRKALTDMYGAETALLPPILYGGSVEAANASAILKEGRVDGLLIGHASLVPEEITTILKNADEL